MVYLRALYIFKSPYVKVAYLVRYKAVYKQMTRIGSVSLDAQPLVKHEKAVKLVSIAMHDPEAIWYLN